jgi:acetylornithine/N-succinyldiaminopimelate aminotransferase
LDKALDAKTTAAFLVEVIQCESGVRPLAPEYLAAAVKFCAERDILLMVDEIQTGIGRTGTFLACESYGIKPDVVTLAKSIAGGIPAGAVLAGEKTAEVFQIGDHGSTFGGNPVAAAAGCAVLDTVAKPDFLSEIARKGEKIQGIIKSWNHSKVTGIRGKGLVLGVDITVEAWPVLEAAISAASSGTAGLLLLTAGKQTLRLIPPYTINDEEIEQGLDILKSVL